LTALAAAMAGCAILGIVIERLVYRPLRGGPTLNVLITAIGMSLFLEYTGQLVFGATPRAFPSIFPAKVIAVHGLIISLNQVIVIVVSAVLMIALQLAVFRTKLGTAMRAVALNPKAAQLVGVNIDVVISFTFGLGSALAAAGGVLYALNYPSIDPLMGVVPGLKAFVAAVLGGVGNIPGAALGALILGMVETFVDGSRWSTYKDAIAFAILIGILLFRPAGLLGRFTAEKV
jgi:branched-chain amino acid transport system permease protein